MEVIKHKNYDFKNSFIINYWNKIIKIMLY